MPTPSSDPAPDLLLPLAAPSCPPDDFFIFAATAFHDPPGFTDFHASSNSTDSTPSTPVRQRESSPHAVAGRAVPSPPPNVLRAAPGEARDTFDVDRDRATSVMASRSAALSPIPDLNLQIQTASDEFDSPPSQAFARDQVAIDGRTSVMRRRHHDMLGVLRSASLEMLDDDEDDLPLPVGLEYLCLRTITKSPSSYLQPGTRFRGTQQSEKQGHDVHVQIQHVNVHESFLCGYLRIQGDNSLTEHHPSLTTYFEGEIVGLKYSFITKHPDWGSNEKVDISHWAKFNAFRPLQKQVRSGQVHITDVFQREHIFMRWKEVFLVPDHTIRRIEGASFEGFYYICFNQINGEISGIYFHARSERFQQLELKHVQDRGCFSAMELR